MVLSIGNRPWAALDKRGIFWNKVILRGLKPGKGRAYRVNLPRPYGTQAQDCGTKGPICGHLAGENTRRPSARDSLPSKLGGKILACTLRGGMAPHKEGGAWMAHGKGPT